MKSLFIHKLFYPSIIWQVLTKKNDYLQLKLIVTDNHFIQIPYNVLNISDYFHKALLDQWDYPSFKHECPICGGKDCAVRIGYYYRYSISLLLGKKFLIKVARYLCQRKNPHFKDKKAHRTFSLLPTECIPYHQYDRDYLLSIAKNCYLEGKSRIDIVASLGESSYSSFDVGHIFGYLMIFQTTCLKLSVYFNDTSFHDPPFTIDFLSKQKLSDFIVLFYKKSGRFVFGTPSQSR